MLHATTKIGQIIEILSNTEDPCTPEEIAVQTTDFTVTEIYPYIRQLEQNNILINVGGEYKFKDSLEAESYIETYTPKDEVEYNSDTY